MVVSIQEPEYKNTLLTVLKNYLPAIIPCDTVYDFLCRKVACVIPASVLN